MNNELFWMETFYKLKYKQTQALIENIHISNLLETDILHEDRGQSQTEPKLLKMRLNHLRLIFYKFQKDCGTEIRWCGMKLCWEDEENLIFVWGIPVKVVGHKQNVRSSGDQSMTRFHHLKAQKAERTHQFHCKHKQDDVENFGIGCK